MNKPKPIFTTSVIEEFCQLCDQAHELWLHHRELFDDNPRADELNRASFTGNEFRRLSVISQEYLLLQIAKLHDPAFVSGNYTLSIAYITAYGGWSPKIFDRLQTLKDDLDRFAKPLRDARHKLLSHNDLDAILAGNTLGEFTKDDDIRYFETLKEFVNVIHDEVLGGPFILFNTFVKNDVEAFLAAIKQQ